MCCSSQALLTNAPFGLTENTFYIKDMIDSETSIIGERNSCLGFNHITPFLPIEKKREHISFNLLCYKMSEIEQLFFHRTKQTPRPFLKKKKEEKI